MGRTPRRLLAAAATASALVLALTVSTHAQTAAPGGFLETTTSTAVRARTVPALPARGSFVFPAPYNTAAARLTNAGDCGGQDCVDYVGYSYWRNINYHVGSDSLLVFITLDRSRGGGGPTLFSYNKATEQVTVLGPLFDASSPFSWATGEGWYFSASQATKLYVPSGGKLHRYDVLSRQLDTVFDAATQFGADKLIWQVHSSNDDTVHSATLRSSSTWQAEGCVVYNEPARRFTFFAKTGDFDECQVDKSGQWLLIKQQMDGANGEDNLIVNLATGSQTVFVDPLGAAGHSDSGYAYMVAEDNWFSLPGAIRVWRYDQTLPGGAGQGTLVYHTTSWGIDAGHIAHSNAVAGAAAGQQMACASHVSRQDLPRANEIVCFRLDGSLQVLVVAPVMTDLNAAGGGDDYAKLPKGNLDVTGQYFVWTSNAGSGRLDAFIVKVPAHLLGVSSGGGGTGGGGTGGGGTGGGGTGGGGTGGGGTGGGTVTGVTWTNVVNATAGPGTLQKTAGCDGCPDAGALSHEALLAGNGYLQFTASETDRLRYIGLGPGNRNTGYTEIRHAIALQRNGIAEVRERGRYLTDTRFVTGDVFKIAVEGPRVRYYKNGQLIYQSTMAVRYPLRVDVSLFAAGATLQGVTLQQTP